MRNGMYTDDCGEMSAQEIAQHRQRQYDKFLDDTRAGKHDDLFADILVELDYAELVEYCGLCDESKRGDELLSFAMLGRYVYNKIGDDIRAQINAVEFDCWD